MNCIIALALAALAQTAAQTPEQSPGAAALTVLDFGAVPGGQSDCTAAFQGALDAAGAAGGIVFVPAGRYRFDGNLKVPPGVSLRGVFSYAPSHAGFRDANQQKPARGSILEPRAGAGKEEGEAFITLDGNATLQGFSIYYPDQDPAAAEPTPYPYTVALRGNNPAALDLELLNPYNGIDASRNQRALIRNIHGQPLHIGVFVDRVFDVGRIENVHWNPWWSYKTPIFEWQMEHGVGFLFAKTDWHYVLNTFCFGYNVGYKFIANERGAANGNFLGIGADNCWTAVLAEETAPMGVLITNGEFVSFSGPDPTMLRVRESHTGTLRLSNCAFWGKARRNAAIDGYGTVGFSDCTFMQWGYPGKGNAAGEDKEPAYAIEARGGSLLVRGCEFMEDKPQVYLGQGVQRAIITGNLIAGKTRIKDRARARTVIKDNLGTPTGRSGDAFRKAPGFRAYALR